MTPTEAIIPIITSVVAVSISVYTVILQRRKILVEADRVESDADNELVTTAMGMVTVLRGEVAGLRADLDTERNERKRRVSELTAQLADKDRVISGQASEILDLKREVNRLSRRIGTGDLPAK